MRNIASSIKSIENNAMVWFLFLILFIFALLRLPSLVEPDWYGDEGIYQVIGMALGDGRVLYQGIWDNKPPVLYLLYALVDGNLFFIRFLSLIFGAAATFFFFLLAAKLFRSKLPVILSTAAFTLLFGLPILEGNIANAENFMLAPTILAALLVFESPRSIKPYLFSGLLLSLAFLTKIVALFDFSAFLFFLLVVRFSNQTISLKTLLSMVQGNRILKNFRPESIFVLSFLIPVGLTFVYFFTQGALSDYLKAAFSQNVGYVGYGNYFLFPNGLLFLKVFALLTTLGLVLKFRQRLGKSGVFIFIWLSFSVFNALFSQRPYTHYLLVALPATTLFLGYIWENRQLIVLNGVLFFSTILILGGSFGLGEKVFTYSQSFSYYQNYLSFIFGQKDLTSYQAFFDRTTPRDYALADFIRANTSEKEGVFLWSDSGQIYALANKLPPGRYIVSYHITFYKDALEETQRAIEKSKPKYIIATKDLGEGQKLLGRYYLKESLEGVQIYERKKI